MARTDRTKPKAQPPTDDPAVLDSRPSPAIESTHRTVQRSEAAVLLVNQPKRQQPRYTAAASVALGRRSSCC